MKYAVSKGFVEVYQFIIFAPKGPIVKRPRQTMRCLLKNVRASVSVCVCLSVCLSRKNVSHPSSVRSAILYIRSIRIMHFVPIGPEGPSRPAGVI